MKEIKLFIEMMEGDALLRALGHERWALQAIQATCAYESLKALADKPIPKMEITDELLDIALRAYFEKTMPGACFHDIKIRAALEAVFDHIGYQESRIHTERPLKEPLHALSEPEKFKMPVPEQGEYDWSKLNHGLYKIYWKDGGCSLASVGLLHSGKAWFAPCNWTSEDHAIASSHWDIVKDVESVYVDFNRDDEPEEKQEPKKQTLLDFVNDRFIWCGIKEDGVSYPIFKSISEYLEQNK